MAKFPTKIDFGYRTMEVKIVDNPRNVSDQRLYGEINYNNGIIRIEKSLKPDHATAVLLHEILHGLIDEFMIETDGNDEKVCDGLSAGILTVLKLNPDLRKLLLEETK